ncbi:MAG: LLM class flavin-dependent oxidoreductase [Chloroflexia bacterium]|nr:LLM class flavin-dependent oxidoreductase [Chloroflexia bacterium]
MIAGSVSDRARPLKVGLILPETERQMNGGSARWGDLREMARLGEEIGADSLWITDHLIHRVPGEEPRGMWECWSLIAALAAVTERAEIGTLVLCSSFRNPALLAKMADTVEEISNGRLILGIGAGWNEAEYLAFGYPFDHRVDRFAEALAILSGLLRDGHIDFQGTYYSARDCELRPRGPRPNGPPIVVGASAAGPRMLDLAARYGDGWNTWFSSTGNTVEGLLPLLGKVDTACEAAGRDPSSLARSAAVIVAVGPHEPSAMTGPPLTGSPVEIAAGLRAYADAGVSHIQVWLEPNTPAGIAAFAPVLAELDRG